MSLALAEAKGFNRKWNALLSDAGIRYLTMKEAMNFTGEFESWRKRQGDRDDLLESLGSLLQDKVSFQSNTTLAAEEFAKFSQATRKKLKSITYAGFEALIRIIAERNRNASNQFHLIYDLSEQYSPDCLKMFIRLRMMHAAYRQFFTSLSFADDSEFPPLQGADMLAYCFRAEVIGNQETGVCKRLLEIFNSGAKMRPEISLMYKKDDGFGDGFVDLSRTVKQ
jgi:hypothetical protein